MKQLTAILILIIAIGLGWYFLHTPAGNTAALDQALATCHAYPNNSVQTVTETTRLTVYLPRSFFAQTNALTFENATGTASAGWISNAGPAGESYGASADCYAYYYEFDGQGGIDLVAQSSKAGTPQYRVHFNVGPVLGDQTIQYTNDEYGFTFTLPADWQGYTIATSTWTGLKNAESGEVTATSGPELLIRNPKWTAAKPYQDIPIMIFTLAQWNDLQAEKFHIGAAPIGPGELGRNSTYVFALPARYNYAFPEGYQEVEQILATHPLQAK